MTIMERAIALDPLNPRLVNAKVYPLIFARRYPEAIATAERALKMGVDDDQLRLNLGEALLLNGQPREALMQFRRVQDEEAKGFGEAMAAAHLGDPAAADRALAALSTFGKDQLGGDIAIVYAQRGEPDRAISVLERVVADRDGSILQIIKNPLLDPLRDDPRFKALLARLNLP